MRTRLEPLGDRVIVEPTKPEEVTKSGLYIPPTAQDSTQQGAVIAVGPGTYEKGELVPIPLKPGDVVLYGRYSGTEIELDGRKLLVLREGDVLAKVRTE